MKAHIDAGTVPHCDACGSLVKPDIVFFGEQLPARFHDTLPDFAKCDLLIVMGTSLAVQPFASLVDRVSATTPRLLINRYGSLPENAMPSLPLQGQCRQN